MNRTRLLILLLACAVVAHAGAGPGLIVARARRAAVDTVVPADVTFLEARAAQELQTYLGHATGGRFAIVREDSAGARGIFVSQTVLGDSLLGEAVDSVGDEGFVLATVGDAALVVRGGDYGTLYSTYAFLERFAGVRWYVVGDLGEVVPHRPNLVVPPVRLREQPAFHMRWVGGRERDWSLRNRCNAVSDSTYPPALRVVPAIYHIQATLLPSGRYSAAHPEYFALVDGKRNSERNAKLCYGNPTARSAMRRTCSSRR